MQQGLADRLETRLVSMADRHLAAVEYEVTVINARAPVVLVSRLIDHQVRRVAAQSRLEISRCEPMLSSCRPMRT